jgi:hypothetical protein
LEEKEKHDREYERIMFEIRQAELEDRRRREKSEDIEKRSATIMAKRFGDAMKNSMFRMGKDPIDLIALFEHIEELFRVYEVPDDLKVQLMRPFLNERASILLSRLDVAKARSYPAVKDYLIRQFELTPRLYLNRFNNTQCQSDETCVSFCSRLKMLLQYYLNSRNVKTFEGLFALLVSDRVKGILPEDVLKYVLSVEANKPDGWLEYDELARVIDTYQANFFKGKPTAAAIGFSKSPFVRNQFRSKEAPKNEQTTHNVNSNSNASNDSKKTAETVKTCWNCKSKSHIARNCPLRATGDGANSGVDRKPTGNSNVPAQTKVRSVAVEDQTSETTAKSNFCAMTPSHENLAGDTKLIAVEVNRGDTAQETCCEVMSTDSSASARRTTSAPNVAFVSTPRGEHVCDLNEIEREVIDHVKRVNNTDNNKQLSSKDINTFVSCIEESDTLIDDVVSFSTSSANGKELCPLEYISVSIAESMSTACFSALIDTGSEICVVHKRLVGSYEYPVCGQVKLRGIVGSPVIADLTHLTLQLADDPLCNVKALCAVSDMVNEDFIVTRDVVQQLHHQFNCRLLSQTKTMQSVDGISSDETALKTDSNIKSCDVNTTNSDLPISDCNGGQSNSCETQINSTTEADTASTDYLDVDSADNAIDSDLGQASVEALRQEQLADESLAGCWALAKRNKGCYFIRDGLLFRCEKVFGQTFENLVVPKTRQSHVLKLAHDLCGGHMAMKKTRDRIRLSGLTWPTLTKSCKQYCSTCEICQKRARVTCFDSIPIAAIPRASEVFSHWFCDVLGPLNVHEKMEFNFCLVLVDSASRWPACFPLRSVTAKNVCLAMLNLFQYTSMGTSVTLVSSDNASYFKAALTREFMNRIGISPRFHVPGYPSSTGLVERAIGSIKSLIAKVAAEHPKKWTSYLPYIMWALREAPNETTGVPPYLLVYNRLPRGPLAILKESWLGNRDLPVSLGKRAEDFLNEIKENLEAARAYTDEHTRNAQHKYVHYHNLRTRSKKFEVGDKCLILQPDSTSSRVFSRWRGPAEIIEVKSPGSYLVELDGKRMHIHANYLRPFNVRIDQLSCNRTQMSHLIDYSFTCNDCSIIYDDDADFGDIKVVEPELFTDRQEQVQLPSEMIDRDTLQHLSSERQKQLISLLDEFSACFSETPGLCSLVLHTIPTTSEFVPKRLRAYRVPENLKTEVNRQIRELLRLGFITESNSPMASPVVAVLKPSGSVRVCVNYQYLNSYTVPDQIPLPSISEVVQKIGKARFISSFDTVSGYHQCLVAPEDRWKTAFVCDTSQYEWVRCPFGLRSSGCTFIRAVKKIIDPIQDIAESYVDDIAIHSGDVTQPTSNENDEWLKHLDDLRTFLQTVLSSGITLNFKKSQFARSEIKFVGHIVGSGRRRADSDKVATIRDLRVPETKRQVRQILGLFGHFREYIRDFAKYAKPLTDLTSKRIPDHIPWGVREQEAFEKLKELLIEATITPLHVIDCSKPFTILVDACDYAVGGILVQTASDNTDQPVAFASCKFTPTQRRWPVIQKEGYGIVWALKKFKHWIFLGQITVVTDHCPLTYLTETAPKNAKLMRWLLAIQEFGNVHFKYKAGSLHSAPDCISRMVYRGD